MRSRLFSILVLSSFSVILSAQPGIPAGLNLVDAEDYHKSEKLAVECMNWLIDHPFSEKEIERSQMNVFCMNWLAGHPDLRIETYSALMPFAEKYPELVYIHCYGAALCKLKTENCDQNRSNLSGTSAVLKAIEMNKGLEQCETLEMIIKANREGELKRWVEEHSSH